MEFGIERTARWKKDYQKNKGIASFIELSSSAGICIAVSEKILRNAKTEDFDRIVEKLFTKPNARGVVMFVDEDNTRERFLASPEFPSSECNVIIMGREPRGLKFIRIESKSDGEGKNLCSLIRTESFDDQLALPSLLWLQVARPYIRFRPTGVKCPSEGSIGAIVRVNTMDAHAYSD
ncbi:hypothetical protein J437_LFUL013352 [Ladona fulva]|uniref:Uncharacterized protein n=1 Tax=Ladona fulva TaxID=123851 RepID=A0A8K0KHB9_LADFU|nr:hypothetical protein J437_LFUL013352 [Ladona fulva]